MQTPPPLKKSHLFVQIVAQCSETNEKSIFLLFCSCSILFTITKCFYRPKMEKKCCFKRCSMFWNWFLIKWAFLVRFLVFELWSILYFTFVMYSGPRRVKIFYMLVGLHRPKPPFFVWGLRLQAPSSFRLNPKPRWLESESRLQKYHSFFSQVSSSL